MKNKIIFLILFLLFPLTVLADEEVYTKQILQEVFDAEEITYDLENYQETKKQVPIYLFYGHGCSFCKNFLNFLNSIVDEYGEYFRVEAYEVFNNTNNRTLLTNVVTELEAENSGVPFIVIGNKIFDGYMSSYDEEIKDAIMNLYESEDRYDVLVELGVNEKEVVNEEKKSHDVGYIVSIFIIVVGGIGSLIYFARKEF